MLNIRTVQHVRDRVESIKETHAQLDDVELTTDSLCSLYEDTLEAIAKSQSHAPTLAKAALEAKSLPRIRCN